MPMVDVLLIIKFISSLEVAQTQMVPYSTIVMFKKLLVKKWEQNQQRPQIENRES